MKKKIGFLLICICMILLCACSAEKLSPSDTMNWYERKQYSVSKEYPDTSIHIIDSSKDKCLYYESKFEQEEGHSAFVIKDIYEYEYATERVTKLSFLSEEEKNWSLLYYAENDLLIMIDADKNLTLLDSDRKAVAKTNIMELTFPNQSDAGYDMVSVIDARGDGQYVYINGVNADNQGLVFVLDMSLKEKTAFIAGEGVILTALWNDRVQFFNRQNRRLYRYDEELNEIVDDGKIESTFAERSTTAKLLPGNATYDVLYYTGGNRNSENGTKEDYLVGVKEKREEILFDFTTMGIDLLYVESIVCGHNDTYWVWGTTVDGEMVLYRFAPGTEAGDYSLKAQRKCCKIGSLLPVDASFQYALNRFNNTSEEYYFEIMVYQRIYQDRDTAMMHMFLDCRDGVLDGLILDNLEDEFIENDALYDLKDYLRQSEVVSKDRFIPHYFEGVTSSEGDIYALYASFRAFGYAYDEKIDFSDLTQYEELCDEKQPFFSFRGEEDALGYFLTYSGDRFVDEEKGEIHVQEPGFKNMLIFIKDQMACTAGQFDPVMQYCSGESKATRVQVSEPTDYLYYNELFHKQVVFSNIAADGLVIGERRGMLGVCSSSEKKEALYVFYDFLFEPVFYHELYFSGTNMPVFTEEYQLWKDFFLATEDYEDRYGKYNRKYDFEIGMGSARCVIEVGSVTEKEADAAIGALQNIEYVKPMRNAYKMIILEEAQAYFTGNRDLDGVCNNIENRLRLALEENKQ